MTTEFGMIDSTGARSVLANSRLPDDLEEPWTPPSPYALQNDLGVLDDYGVEVRTGSFVWNREQGRMRPERR